MHETLTRKMMKSTVTKHLAYLSSKTVPSLSLGQNLHFWEFLKSFCFMVISIPNTSAILNFILQLCCFGTFRTISCYSILLYMNRLIDHLYNKKLKTLIWFLIFDKAKLWHPISASKQQSCSMTRDTFYHWPRLFPKFPDMLILCKT